MPRQPASFASKAAICLVNFVARAFARKCTRVFGDRSLLRQGSTG